MRKVGEKIYEGRWAVKRMSGVGDKMYPERSVERWVVRCILKGLWKGGW